MPNDPISSVPATAATSTRPLPAVRKTFHFSISMNVDLAIDEIWPDEDAPAAPTVQDVLEVIAKHGGARRIVSDWDLDLDLDLHVSDDKDTLRVPE